MEKTHGREWELCVEEWRALAQQIQEKQYEMPIACLVLNGESTPLVVRDVFVRDGRSLCETTVEIVTGNYQSLILTEERPVRFKVGKDRGGTGKSIFLINLDR